MDGSENVGGNEKKRSIVSGGLRGAKAQFSKLGRRIRRRKDVGKAMAAVKRETADEEEEFRAAVLKSSEGMAAGSATIPSP